MRWPNYCTTGLFAVLCKRYRYTLLNFYPLKPNGISHYYQIGQSISVLRAVGWYILFSFNSIRTSCKQTVETLIRRHILWRLIWVCTVCLCPAKGTLGIYGLNFCVFFGFDLILYVPSTIFQLNREGSTWVEPVLS